MGKGERGVGYWKTDWFVNAALEGAFITSWLGVWIRWVEWADRTAVRAIDSVKKVVEEPSVGVIIFVYWVICLEKNSVLWVEERVRNLKVQV